MKSLLQIAAAMALFGTLPAAAMPVSSVVEIPAGAMVLIKDRMGAPPIDPNLPPVTGQSINAEVNAELAARFAEAAGTSSGLLTASQAKNASWGYVADHFAAIDRDHDGYVKFGDVLDFIHGGPAKPKSVQSVE